MKTLLLFSATLFGVAALSWYFTWAIWIHAPKGWYGKQFSPLRVAEVESSSHDRAARQVFWYRMLKKATMLLFLVTAALLLARLTLE